MKKSILLIFSLFITLWSNYNNHNKIDMHGGKVDPLINNKKTFKNSTFSNLMDGFSKKSDSINEKKAIVSLENIVVNSTIKNKKISKYIIKTNKTPTKNLVVELLYTILDKSQQKVQKTKLITIKAGQKKSDFIIIKAKNVTLKISKILNNGGLNKIQILPYKTD